MQLAVDHVYRERCLRKPSARFLAGPGLCILAVGIMWGSVNLQGAATLPTRPQSHSGRCPVAQPTCRSLRPCLSPAHQSRYSRLYATGSQSAAEEELTSQVSLTDGSDIASAAIEESPVSQDSIPQQRIRIKLKSYNVPAIQQSIETILEAARSTGAKVSGPVYLPTRSADRAETWSPAFKPRS